MEEEEEKAEEEEEEETQSYARLALIENRKPGNATAKP